MNTSTTERPLPTQFDARGNPFWTTRMSTPDSSYAQIAKAPSRVIPVIFVPGVMGSNLRGTGTSKNVEWLLDGESSMLEWAAKGPEYRKQHLRPDTMQVFDEGMLPSDTPLPPEELRRRGWGEVGFMSYAAALSWLELNLHDFDHADGGERAQLRKRALQAMKGEATLTEQEFELSYRYLFPVYACGYNWLDSNVASSKRLGDLIDAVIERYRLENKRCEKVILVTHSMGGMVARHCSEVRGYSDKILGIVHGVLPAVGAAAVYRRFKAGTEGAFGPSLVLGSNAAQMTAVLSSAPGPLQLLPTPEYGNGWLKIKDGDLEHSLPSRGDPYGEIYVVPGKWWGMCEAHLMNPLNKERDPQQRSAQMDRDWETFAQLIDQPVRDFHSQLKGKYHPNTHAFFGSHPQNKSYGTVTWQRIGPARAPTEPMDATAQNPTQISTMRTVRAPLVGKSDAALIRHFVLQNPDENGDGTVPHRSGVGPQAFCKSFLQVNVGHEPAFKHPDGDDNLRACRFTLRAIVKIAQDVSLTSLRYD